MKISKKSFPQCLLPALLLMLPTLGFSANYYWVNGSGNWSDYSSHWAKIPTPVVPADYHLNVPTAGDDVYFGFNGGSAYTLNVDAGSTVPKCRNMDWTGVPAGTVWGGGGGPIDIYGSTTLDPNMSITFTGQIQMQGIATMHDIDCNGVHFPKDVVFTGVGGGWNFVDEFFAGENVYHQGGLIETNGYKVTIGASFFGNSHVPNGQLHLGSSEFVVVGGHGFFDYTNLQFNAGTSHIKVYGANVFVRGPVNFSSSLDFYDVSFYNACTSGGFAWGNVDGTLTFHQSGRIHSYSLGAVPELNNVVFLGDGWIYNATDYHNLTLTAGKTYTIENYAFGTGTDQTILPGGTFTAMGVGTCAQFITIKSWQYGTAVKFVNNSGNDIMTGCLILEDVHADGTNTLTVNDGVNLGNNMGWIFINPNPGLDLYWIGGAGDWNDPNHWSETDGGPAGACLPNGASNVHFTANSGFSPGDVVTVLADAYCLNMDWTGVTGEPEIYHTFDNAVNLHIYGDVRLSTGMKFNFAGVTRFRTNSVSTITSASNSFQYTIVFEGAGTWELQDSFKQINYSIYHERGTFKTLGHPMIVNQWLGNWKEDGSGATANMGAELFLGVEGVQSSNVHLVKSPYNDQKGQFRGFYETGKFHAVQSHLIGEHGGYIDCHPTIYHDFWDVTFNPIDHAGEFLYGNILNKLTFLAFGNLAGPNTHIHEVEFHQGSYTSDDHTYDILTIYGGYAHKFQPYSGEGSTVQTITAGGVFNHINPSCENPTILFNPTPGQTTTFRKQGAGTVFNIQHTIFDRVHADQTSGAIYSATNCVAVQPDVETSWNITNPAPRDLYWVGGDGNWNSATHWSLASGSAGGECPPTPLDNVFFDGASGFSTGDAVTISQRLTFCKNMDWTGISGNPSLATADPLNKLHIFGSLKFSAGMTNNYTGSVYFRAAQAATIMSSGQQFKGNIYFWNPDGQWTLLDDLSLTSSPFSVIAAIHSYGSLNTNDKNVVVGGWNYDNANVVTTSASAVLTLGSSKLKISNLLYGNVGAFGFFYYFPGQFSSGTSEIIFEGLAYSRLFAPGHTAEFYDVTFKTPGAYFENGKVKNKLLFEKAGGMSQYINGDYSIHDLEFQDDAFFSTSYGTSARDVHSIKFAPGKRYTFAYNFTLNVVPHNGQEGQFIAQGLPGQYIEMKSTNFNIPATIHKDDYDGTSTCTKYLFLTGMTHTGTEDIYVPTPGGDVFNNAGWQFFPCNPCPASIPELDAASITIGCAPGVASLILANLQPDEWANGIPILLQRPT